MLTVKGRTIYFNEELHKYTDELENPYTSCTTLIGKYTPHKDFDAIAESCERIGKNPRHQKYLKYKGKTKKQLLHEWSVKTDIACEKGSVKHNYLEGVIKDANGYNKNAKGFINGKIYTMDTIITDHSFGTIDLAYFETLGLNERYPKIFNLIRDFVNLGFRIYAEIGVYDPDALVSGLIDLYLVNNKGEFIIMDWKTNEAPLMFEAGYFEKDNNGKLTQSFINTDDKFLHPLEHVVCSTGNKYTMQLSNYAYMAESFGFKCVGLILCHIRTVGEVEDYTDYSKDVVEIYSIEYMKAASAAMFNHWQNNNEINTQYKMFNHV